MKTIEQIFKDNGSVFPFEIIQVDYIRDDVICIVARTPEGEWVGWYKANCHGCVWAGTSEEWLPYKEPKPTKKLYPYLRWGCSEKRYVEINYFKDEECAKQCCYYLYIGPHPTLEPIDLECEE